MDHRSPAILPTLHSALNFAELEEGKEGDDDYFVGYSLCAELSPVLIIPTHEFSDISGYCCL